MVKQLTLSLVLVTSFAQAQYFHHWYNRSLVPANASNETFYDGIRTRNNYGAANPNNYYNIGYGATFLSPVGAITTDEARFVRTSKTGAAVAVNTGTSFADVNTAIFHNTYGHAICEINNGLGTGGYLAVGNVSSNFATGSVVPGGSDGLFYKVNNAGNPTARFRFDSNGGADFFTDIIASTQFANTYYVCGYTHRNTYDDAIVMSIQANGTVNWFKTYQFDPTWTAASGPTANCRAYGLAEDAATGNIFVVGYIQDFVPAPAVFNAGLFFKLSPAGIVLCAQAHNSPNVDHQYHDIIQKSNGDLAICGFTSSSSTPGSTFNHIWLTEMNTACGMINTFMYDHVAAAGLINESKGYSIKERQNTNGAFEYYIAGPDINNTAGGGIFVSVNKISAGAGNAPIAWYDYPAQQAILLDDNYCVDYANAGNTSPGLRIFSNTVSPVVTNPFNDCVMIKSYFNGANCTNLCPNNILIQSILPITIATLPDSVKTVYKRKALVANITNYTFGVVCSQAAIACGSNAREFNNELISPESDLEVFPNPAEDLITYSLYINQQGNYTISLIDITGRIVDVNDQFFLEGKQQSQLDLSGLAKGLYQLRITNGDQNWIKKIVIQ